MSDPNIEVQITADASGLERQVRGARGEIDRLGPASGQMSQRASRNFQIAGTAMVAIGTAAIGVGARSVGLANEFETNFARIEGLVGVARDEVDAMRDSVLGLSGETARSPQELSAALFTITSAGLRGEEAMEALEVAARGSAAGLGDTGTVAQAMAGFLNAYASSGIDAAEAGDFLAATARAGNFEVSQLAGSLGQVTPIASTLGVSTGDLGGSIALLTRTSGNASQAITQVRAVLNAMLRPSGEATRILGEFGITGQDVRDTLQEDGLVAALGLLEDAAGGDQEAFAAMLGSSEAIGGALTILDADAQTLTDTFGAVENSTGVLDEAFDAVAGTSAFEMEQAMTDITTALTEIGTVVATNIAPIISGFADVVTFLADAFGSLPGPIQTVAVALGALAIPMGAGLIAWGRYGDSIRSAATSMRGGTGALGRLGTLIRGNIGPTIAITAAVTAGALIYKEWADRKAEARARAEQLTTAIQDQAGSLPQLVTSIGELTERYEELTGSSETAEGAVQDLGVEAGVFFDRLAEMGTSGGQELFDELGVSAEELVPILQTGTDAFGEFQGVADNFGLSALESSQQLAILVDEAEDIPGAAGDMIRSMLDGADAGTFQAAAFADLLDVMDEQADAYDDVTDQQRDAALAAVRLARESGVLTEAEAREARAAINTADNYGALQAEVQAVVDIQAANIATAEGAAAAHEREGAQLLALHGASRDASTSLGELGDTAGDTVDDLDAVAEAGVGFADEARNMAESGELFEERLGAISGLLSEVDDLLNALNGSQQGYDAAVLDTLVQFDDLETVLAGVSVGYNALGEAVTRQGLEASTAGRSVLETSRDTAEAIRDETLARIENGETVGSAIENQNLLNESLRQQLLDAGIAEEAIEELILAYGTIPDEVITRLEADAEQAFAETEAAVAELLAYGELTPEALLQANPELALADVAAAVAAVHGYDAETATAALFGDASQFDEELAASVLSLGGFDVEEATALLRGDPAQLDATMRVALADLAGFDISQAEADLDADNTDAVTALIGYEILAAIFGARRDTATLAADTDNSALTTADRELDQAAMPGGGARTAVLSADLRGDGTVRRELNTLDNSRGVTLNVGTSGGGTASSNIDYWARNRSSTIYVYSTRVNADGDLTNNPGNASRPNPGVFNAPTAIFGEAGPEAFIPLSPERRSSAIPILEQAAAQLGVPLLAKGGILQQTGGLQPRGAGVASPVRSTSSAGGGETTVNLTVNNPSPEPASTTLPAAMRRLAVQGVVPEPLGRRT
jgi:TP901 family phage tail tape measure protein